MPISGARIWYTLACCLVAISTLTSCIPALVPIPPIIPTVTARPVPSDTPRPTATVKPTATRTPTPTATPEPHRIAVAAGAPGALERLVDRLVASNPQRYRRAAEARQADVTIAPQPLAERAEPGGQRLVAEQVLVPVVPFPTLVDDVAWADVQRYWAGEPEALRGLGSGVQPPALYVLTDTLEVLTAVLGPPSAAAPIHVVARDELMATVWDARPLAWAIVPFDELEPRWKVLRLDGQSALDKQLDMAAYPLAVRWMASGPDEALRALGETLAPADHLTDRDVRRMTVLIMTGVTAPSRHTMATIERVGDVLYPAADVGPLLRSADITHLSNEVSFFDGCPPGEGQGGALCGKANYIELLKASGADVIELTGNHMNDYGREPFAATIHAYYDAGMVTYGGGLNLTAALSPTIVTSNGNRIAFLGCNTVGPDNDFATADGPGSAPCDYDLLFTQLNDLRAQDRADVLIFTYQFLETQDGFYHYESTAPQRAEFHRMAEAGADIVSGSQAHQPQGFSFSAGGHFISYGLGNLFFDQMFSLGTRQGLIERHVIYNGRHVSTELITTLLYDSAQPRITTGDDRGTLLYTLFGVSDWP